MLNRMYRNAEVGFVSCDFRGGTWKFRIDLIRDTGKSMGFGRLKQSQFGTVGVSKGGGENGFQIENSLFDVECL